MEGEGSNSGQGLTKVVTVALVASSTPYSQHFVTQETFNHVCGSEGPELDYEQRRTVCLFPGALASSIARTLDQ